MRAGGDAGPPPQSKMPSGQWAVTTKFGTSTISLMRRSTATRAQQVGLHRVEAVLATQPLDHPRDRVLRGRHQVGADAVGGVPRPVAERGVRVGCSDELRPGDVEVLAHA